MKVIRIGVILALYDVTYDNAIQTTLDGLNLAKILNLKTNVSEDCCYLLGRKVDVDILL